MLCRGINVNQNGIVKFGNLDQKFLLKAIQAHDHIKTSTYHLLETQTIGSCWSK